LHDFHLVERFRECLFGIQVIGELLERIVFVSDRVLHFEHLRKRACSDNAQILEISLLVLLDGGALTVAVAVAVAVGVRVAVPLLLCVSMREFALLARR